jgi:hypothetical protein
MRLDKHMRVDFAQVLMEEFADATGVSGKAKPRRYLWTDAFAVCNFLGLARETHDNRYLRFARELINQVHHVLGRHREDDPRQGWISGLPEEEGELHPTHGGLRIGKPLNEREADQPADPQLEWHQDGQYYHYLTKWMHALFRMGQETDEPHFQRWAAELAITAHKAFSYRIASGGPKRLVWKMSIDLSRSLVSSIGHHDPLDGLITYLELQTADGFSQADGTDLAPAIADLTQMCALAHWATDDLLGIGGLLDAATRLAELIFERGITQVELLHQLLVEVDRSLQRLDWTILLRRPADHRLAFRELGLAIGLQGMPRIRRLAEPNHTLVTISERLQQYQSLAEHIEAFWSDPTHRSSETWIDHCDINTVMLATSLAPEGYLRL